MLVRLAVEIAAAHGAETGAIGPAEDLVGQLERDRVARPGGEVEAVVLDVRRRQLVRLARARGLVLAALNVHRKSRVAQAAEAGAEEPHVELELEHEARPGLRQRQARLGVFRHRHVTLASELERLELDLADVPELVAGAELGGAKVEDRHDGYGSAATVAHLDLRPFSDDHLDEAAELLASRHSAHRAAEPLLADANAREALEAAWRREGASGFVAVRDGEVVGYLLGRVADSRYLGRHAWIERAGHASAEPEAIRDLYAAAAPVWVESGVERHYAVVPVLDDLLDPWYRLGFGQMHMEAIRRSGGHGRELPPGVTIRRGGPDDVEAAAIPVDGMITDLQELSPSFLPNPLSDEQERADWAETFEDPDAAYFVVEREERILGHSLLYRPDQNMGIGPDVVYLASTATIPEVRGTGVGLALTDHVLAWAAEAGYARVVTNWRVSNLLASRFWPARGFRPTFIRLYRALGTG